jgi:hypothetical protein
MPVAFMVTLGGIFTCGVVAVVLLLLGYPDAAWFVGNFGTFLWLIGVLLWIVFFDSKKRWPNTKAMDRAMNVMTFRR